jgi:CBS domain-containing protein
MKPMSELRKSDSEWQAREAARWNAVSGIMTPEPAAVGPEILAESAVRMMDLKGISRLPVVDADRKLLGVFTLRDYAADRAAEGNTSTTSEGAAPAAGMHMEQPGPTVSDLMAREPLSVRQSDTISHACELMAVHHVHGLPVVDRAGVLVGVVSALDVAAWIATLR